MEKTNAPYSSDNLSTARSYVTMYFDGKHVPREVLGLFLNVSEVAELIGVHNNTIRRWTDSDMITAYRLGTRHDRRIKFKDVLGYLEKSRKPYQSSTIYKRKNHP